MMIADFNPRPRKEGDNGEFSYMISDMDFNPRPRKEGDRTARFTATATNTFQSTPSQRGRLDARVTISNNYFISIHALAKRATGATRRWDYN